MNFCHVHPAKKADTEIFLPEEIGYDSFVDIGDDNHEDFEDLKRKIKSPWRIRIKLKNTALTSDHIGLTHSAKFSSVLQNFGIVIGDDTHPYFSEKNL